MISDKRPRPTFAKWKAAHGERVCQYMLLLHSPWQRTHKRWRRSSGTLSWTHQMANTKTILPLLNCYCNIPQRNETCTPPRGPWLLLELWSVPICRFLWNQPKTKPLIHSVLQHNNLYYIISYLATERRSMEYFDVAGTDWAQYTGTEVL